MDKIDLVVQRRFKRSFRARRKLNLPNVVSHITQQTAGKEPFFVEEDDFRYMMELLREVAGKHSLSLFAFCLMPSNIHLLLMPQKENLQHAMREIFSLYATRFNKKYRRSGHLFGGPYRQEVCLDPSYLLAVCAFIHLSPVKAGLAEDFLDYPWSSAPAYFGTNGFPSFVDSGYVLGLLSDDPQECKARCRQILQESNKIAAGYFPDQEHSIDTFRIKLLEALPQICRWTFRSGKVARVIGVDLLPIDELENRIEFVRSLPKRSPDVDKAKRFLVEQMLARGFKRSEIAERLQVCPKTLYNILARRRGGAQK